MILLLQKEKFDRAASRQMAVNRKMKESNIQRDFAAGNRWVGASVCVYVLHVCVYAHDNIVPACLPCSLALMSTVYMPQHFAVTFRNVNAAVSVGA